MKSITLAEAVGAFQRGEQVIFCEYRLSKADHIQWRDKTSGKMLEADVLSHTVETAEASIRVDERVPEGKTNIQVLEETRRSIPKGARVLVRFQSLAVNKGMVTCRGTIQPVEDSSRVAQPAESMRSK